MIYGDTGRRDISSLFSEPFTNGNALISIENRDIHLYFNYARWASAQVTCQLPADWGALFTDFQAIVTMDGPVGYVQFSPTGLITVKRPSASAVLRGGVRFRARTWPASQVGIPA